MAKIFYFIKESKSSYFFEWQKSKQKTISFFVKKRNKKTTPFRIRNSLVKTFSQYLESPSLRGFAEAIYINWIASLIRQRQALAQFVRNDKFKIYNDNKNKLAILTTRGFPNGTPLVNPLHTLAIAHNGLKPVVILQFKLQKYFLNLVKTFLTSIKFTFDSLSRKIKNPCLVINNSFYRRNSMKNSKKLFLIVLSVLIVAFVSCKSNEDPEGGSAPFTVSSIVGTWTSTVDSNNTFTVADNGNITVSAGTTSATLTITSWDTDKDQSVTQYAITLSATVSSQQVDFTFTFKSANSCDLTMTGATGSEPFTKQ